MISVQVSTQSPSIFQPFVLFWVPKSRGAWMEFHHGGSNIQKSIHLKPEPKQQSCDETGCTGWTLEIMNLERDNMLSELELPPTKKCTSNFEQVWVKLWTLKTLTVFEDQTGHVRIRWFIVGLSKESNGDPCPIMSFPLFHPETCSECHCERLRVKFWRLDIEHLWPTSRQLHLRKNWAIQRIFWATGHIQTPNWCNQLKPSRRRDGNGIQIISIISLPIGSM